MSSGCVSLTWTPDALPVSRPLGNSTVTWPGQSGDRMVLGLDALSDATSADLCLIVQESKVIQFYVAPKRLEPKGRRVLPTWQQFQKFHSVSLLQAKMSHLHFPGIEKGTLRPLDFLHFGRLLQDPRILSVSAAQD
jgi:hypothetical protein